MHIAHRKFSNTRPVTCHDYYNRVVSVCWTFDAKKNLLRYGASVFRREYEDERWTKRSHRETAEKRYTEKPILVVLSENGLKKQRLTNNAIEYFICRKLIYLLGCRGSSEISSDLASKFNYDFSSETFQISIPKNFNKIYNFNTGLDQPRFNFHEHFDCECDYDDPHSHSHPHSPLSQGCVDMMFFSLGICISIIGVSGYHYLL